MISFTLVVMPFYLINLTFLWTAFTDAYRKNYLMAKLSESLEFDFHNKDPVSVRLPTLNFLDTDSLLTWLEVRKLTLELGSRFHLRIQLYISFFIILDGLLLLLLFAMGSGLVKSDILSTKAWIVIGVHAGFLTIILLGVLLPTSYINKQTMW